MSPRSGVALALLMFLTNEASACPDCAVGRVVRASVFDGNFWTNLAMISLPLVVLGVISALLYRIGIERPPRARLAAREEPDT